MIQRGTAATGWAIRQKHESSELEFPTPMSSAFLGVISRVWRISSFGQGGKIRA
jgi:hypothetical protein